MADKKYGILLTAKDEASKAVLKLSKTMGASTKAVKKLGSVGGAAFKGLRDAVILANQGTDLLMKAFGPLVGAVGSTIDAFAELRGEANPLVMQFSRLRDRTMSLKSALGSGFVGAIVAIGKAFDPVIKRSVEFLDKNRKLIATKIVQFLFKAARALTEGIASALQTVNDLWATWNVTVDTAVVTITNWLGAWTETMLVIGGSEKQLALYNKRLDKLADANHKAKLRIDAAGEAHQNFSGDIEKTKQAILKLINEGYKPAVAAAKVLAESAGGTPLESAGNAILRIKDYAFDLIPALDKVAGQFGSGLSVKEGTTAFEQWERRIDRVNRQLGVAGPKSISAIRAELEKLYSDMGVELDFKIDMENVELATEALQTFTDTAEISLLDAKESFMLLNDTMEQTVSLGGYMTQAFGDLATTISDAGGAMVDVLFEVRDGTYEMGDAFIVVLSSVAKGIIDTVKTAILAYAAEAAAKQYAAHASYPWGLVVGAAAGAAMLGAVSALLGKVPEELKVEKPVKANRGGIVPGHRTGRDTVPAMLTPGELVIPADITDLLLGRKGSRNFNKGGIVSRDAGAGVVVNFNEQSIMPRTPAEMERFVRDDLVPVLNRLKRKGAFA